MRRASCIAALATLAIAPRVFSQTVAPSVPASVELIGPADQQRIVNLPELRKLASTEVEVPAHNVHGRYRGVAVGDLLRLVGRPAGDSLRGAALAWDVVIEGSDGYRVVFAPAELDAGFTDKIVLLAFEKNGAPLDSSEGPFRLISAGEKRPARWVRGVARIRLRAVAP